MKEWGSRVNQLRHGYASYNLALTSDPNKVATELGNSPEKLYTNYNKLRTPAQAEQWFSVVSQEKRLISLQHMQAEEIYSVDGLPPEWGGVVARFVEGHATKMSQTMEGGSSISKLCRRRSRADNLLLKPNNIHSLCGSGPPSLRQPEILDWVLGMLRVASNMIRPCDYIICSSDASKWLGGACAEKLPQTKKIFIKKRSRLKRSVVLYSSLWK